MKWICFTQKFGAENTSWYGALYHLLYDVEYRMVDGEVEHKISNQILDTLADELLHPLQRSHRISEDITNLNETT